MREKMKNREGAGGKLIGQVRSECRDVSTETHINKEYIDNQIYSITHTYRYTDSHVYVHIIYIHTHRHTDKQTNKAIDNHHPCNVEDKEKNNTTRHCIVRAYLA